MKVFISVILLVPILVFAAVVATVIRRAQAAPSAFSIKDFPMPSIGEPPKSDDPQILAGWKVYTAKGCVYCHGPNGSGGVKNHNAQGGEVPSLSKVSQGYTPEELKTKILNGVREIQKENSEGGAAPLYMPVWKGHISDEELDAVVAFLNSLAPKGSPSEEF